MQWYDLTVPVPIIMLEGPIPIHFHFVVASKVEVIPSKLLDRVT